MGYLPKVLQFLVHRPYTYKQVPLYILLLSVQMSFVDEILPSACYPLVIEST